MTEQCNARVFITVNARIVGVVECGFESGHGRLHRAMLEWVDGARIDIPEAHAPTELSEVELVPITADDELAPLLLDEVEAADPLVATVDVTPVFIEPGVTATVGVPAPLHLRQAWEFRGAYRHRIPRHDEG